jgi:cobalt/nickel transport system permease protein
MHIPDGFIPILQCAVYWLFSIFFIIMALRWARKNLDESRVPILAVFAAGIFAIQALNVPIPWGTSGHVVGGVLTAIVFASPWAGVIALTLVVVIQALVFGDGGITVMGANIFLMGVVGTFAGYYLYSFLAWRIRLPLMFAVFSGAWTGLFTSAVVTSLVLAIAGTFPLIEGLVFMGTYHAVIGIVAEGVITVAVLSLLMYAAPDVLPEKLQRRNVT